MEAIDQAVVAGSAALSLGELQTLVDILCSVDGRLPIPAAHPAYRRLTQTLQGCGDAEVARALRVVSLLSTDKGNRNSCLQLMLDAGPQVEAYLATHAQLNSRVDASDDQINRDVLSILLRVSDYELTGQEALEAFSGHARQCMQTICSLLRQVIHTLPPIARLFAERPQFWIDDVCFIVGITRILYELSTYETYFRCVCAEDTNTDQPIETLARQYQDYIGGLSNLAAHTPVMDLAAAILDQWFELIEANASFDAVHLLPHFEAALGNVLLFVCNLLTVTTQFSQQFKKHLAMSTVLVQNVVLPCMLFELDLFERRVFSSEDAPRHMRLLLLVIKVVSLVSNKIKVFRPWLRKFPYLGARIARNEVMLQSDHRVEFIALVARLVVNAELMDSLAALLDLHATLSDAEKHRLAVRLANPRETMYPVNVFSGAYVSLRPLFELRRDKLAELQRPVANPLSDAKVPFPKVVHRDEDEEGGRNWPRRSGGRASRRRNLQRFINMRQSRRRQVQRRYRLMAKARATHECADADDESVAAGGASSSSSDVEAEGAKAAIAVRELPTAARLNEALVAQYEDEPEVTVAIQVACGDAVAPGAPSTTAEEGGLDDEDEVLDDDGGAPQPPPPFDLSPWRKAPPLGVPKQYLCALSHQMMRIPVISPYGDVFDKAAITDFLRVHPRTCPLTGAELYPTDLVVDATFRRELDAVRLNFSQ